MTPPLTIAIPTFDRNATLGKTLELLLPQLTPQCALLIVDNASPTPVKDTLAPLLARFPDVAVRIERNAVNIGANANILRCLEKCETSAIWMLGDDDPPKPDAVAIVLGHLQSHPGCVLWNFSFDDARPLTFESKGLREMARKMDISANLPWVSNCVYSTKPLQACLKFGYQFAFSMLPHVAMLLMALGNEGGCCFSRERLIELDAQGPPDEQRWSRVVFALSVPTIFDLPIPSDVRELLARKLLVTYWGESVDLKVVVRQLLTERLHQRDAKSTMYFFDQLVARSTYFNATPRFKLKLRVYRLMLRFPHVANALFFVAKRRRLDAAPQDKYARI